MSVSEWSSVRKGMCPKKTMFTEEFVVFLHVGHC